MRRAHFGALLVTVTLAACTGDATARTDDAGSKAAASVPAATKDAAARAKPHVAPPPAGDMYLRQTPAAYAESERGDFGLGDNFVDKLLPYPDVKPGDRTPFDLWRYAGKGGNSWASPVLGMPWEDWLAKNAESKPTLMADVAAYMASRYDFSGRTIDGATMSGGKPIMAGPASRLPEGIASWEALASLSSEEIRARDIFPFKPLAHPLHSTAHMVFPNDWVEAHPEFRRIDLDHDWPDEYLPEFPPPMFLTTHKEMGDVTGGAEVTLGNYYDMFNGLLTPEQMEGLERLLRPTPTSWFNHTSHRVTEDPSAGVGCLSCHTNGHTNGAFALGPDSRPNLARLRTDTPTIRGNFNVLTLSSKRAIRGLDHFAEVEEYFDGDPALGQAMGFRGVQDSIFNRMGDFMAIVDYPPAPKLDPLGRLRPAMATDAELRGESLFWGKARCAQCHSGPAFVDDYMHDLQVERFYVGRPEGAIKTFPLRGIKDSPPYLHDGRLPTLHDVVEFFNLVLELQLSAQDKEDLVAYLLCL